ncbi:hypothetical protein BpHYR1_054614 [Brachionus plicatilis]|uniref:Uncharacterized protein n=1 Tax=Brachionus plicatilis TaxID=10195 RepID=A0A3M7QYF0_BRAPC|nr:hypothetical protein BpHYR1_054614 [Brachionus plicatilis]
MKLLMMDLENESISNIIKICSMTVLRLDFNPMISFSYKLNFFVVEPRVLKLIEIPEIIFGYNFEHFPNLF